VLSPREAAHRLAEKPAPGFPAGRLPSVPVVAPMAAAPRVLSGRATRSVAAKKKERAGLEPGAMGQLVAAGKSLIALFNAVAVVKARLDPPPAIDAAHPEALAGKPEQPVPPAKAAAVAEASAAAPAAEAQPAFKPIPKGSILTRGWHLIKAAVTSWIDDFAPSMGAALSYYTVFSLAPMLLIVIAVAGLIFGADAARGEIVTQLRGLMGDQGAKAVEELLKSASDPGQGRLAPIIGSITLLIGATAVFAELQSSLDRIWRTPAPPNQNGIWGLIRTRILSFGLILGLGVLMIVSLVASAALAALGKWWGGLLGNWELVLQALNFLVSFGVVTVMFAAIYKFMPHAKISWRDVWTGAAVTALLFSIGKFLIGLYIGKSGVASSFGAAGSFAVLLVWVYYSAQIFLLGAEFTWVYSHRNAPPPSNAVVPARSQAATA
jgi:membrane protein